MGDRGRTHPIIELIPDKWHLVRKRNQREPRAYDFQIITRAVEVHRHRELPISDMLAADEERKSGDLSVNVEDRNLDVRRRNKHRLKRRRVRQNSLNRLCQLSCELLRGDESTVTHASVDEPTLIEEERDGVEIISGIPLITGQLAALRSTKILVERQTKARKYLVTPGDERFARHFDDRCHVKPPTLPVCIVKHAVPTSVRSPRILPSVRPHGLATARQA